MITVYETMDDAKAMQKPNLVMHPISVKWQATGESQKDMFVRCVLGYSSGEKPEVPGRLVQKRSLASLYERAIGAPLVPIKLQPQGEERIDFGIVDGYSFDNFDDKCQFALANAQLMLSFACGQIVCFHSDGIVERSIQNEALSSTKLLAAALAGGILHIGDITYRVKLSLYATAEVYENLFLTSGVAPFKHDKKGDPYVITMCGSNHAPCLLSRVQGQARFTLDTEDIDWWEFDGSNDDDYAGAFNSLADFDNLLGFYTMIHGRHYVEENTSGSHGMYHLDLSNLSIYPGISDSLYKNYPCTHPRAAETDDVMYEAVYGNSMQKFGTSKTISPHVFRRETTAACDAVIDYSPGTAVTRVRRAIAAVMLVEGIWLKSGARAKTPQDYLLQLGDAVVKRLLTEEVQIDDPALLPYLRLAVSRTITLNSPPSNAAMSESRADLRDGCTFSCSVTRPANGANYVSPVNYGDVTTNRTAFGGNVLTAPAAGPAHGKSGTFANREYFVKTDTTEGIRYNFDDTINAVSSWPEIVITYSDAMDDCDHINGWILTGDGYWYGFKQDDAAYNHQAIALAHNGSMVPVPAAMSLVCIEHASFDVTDWVGGDITVRDVAGWELAIPIWNLFALADIGGARETSTYAYGHAAVLQVG